MRTFIALTVFCATTCFAADVRWGLRWNAPPSCISAAELATKVEARLGHPAFALNPDFRIDGVMEEGTAPRWKARLTVVSAAGEVMGSREWTGDDASCRALDARIAFIVATSIDEHASAPPQPSPPAPVATPAPAPAPAPPRLQKPPGTVWVELETDDPQATLYRHVGTSYGMVGGASAVITTISKECTAPCAQFIEQPKSDFFLSGPGITVSDTFSLLTYPSGVKLKVKTGSSVMRYLGVMLGLLGVTALAVGIPFTVIAAGKSQPTMTGVQNPYGSSSSASSLLPVGLGFMFGGAAALGGSVPMIVFSSTKVEFFPLPDAPTGVRANTSEI